MERPRIIEALMAEDGQVASYVLKIAIVFIILALLLAEAVPIIINHFAIGGIANSAATEAVKALQSQRNKNDLVALAKTVQDYLSERGAKLAGPIEVGETEIRVPVKKIRETFFFSHVSFLCRYVEADAVGVDTK